MDSFMGGLAFVSVRNLWSLSVLYDCKPPVDLRGFACVRVWVCVCVCMRAHTYESGGVSMSAYE